ncbi:MAG: nuclear transport factor 2 family protein [Myxococcales bacterium]
MTFDEDAALARRFTASWGNGDRQNLLACADRDMEFDWSDSRSPFRGTYLGHLGLMRLWVEMWEAWDEISIEIQEAIECPDGRLVTVNLVRARGKGSGVATEARGAILWTVSGGKIQRAKLFQEKEQALASC